jgi:hypothetical protein
MHYNVPSSKTHQFKINGVEEVTIDSDGIELGVDNFIVYNHAYSGSERTGGGGDTLHPDIWIRAKFGNSEIRIPAYYQ